MCDVNAAWCQQTNSTSNSTKMCASDDGTDVGVNPDHQVRWDSQQTDTMTVSNFEETNDEDVPLGLQRMRARLGFQEAREERVRQAIELASTEALALKRSKFEKIRQRGIKQREHMRKKEEAKETKMQLQSDNMERKSSKNITRKNSHLRNPRSSSIQRGVVVGTGRKASTKDGVSKLEKHLAYLYQTQMKSTIALDQAVKALGHLSNKPEQTSSQIASEDDVSIASFFPVSLQNHTQRVATSTTMRTTITAATDLNQDCKQSDPTNMVDFRSECRHLLGKIEAIEKRLKYTENMLHFTTGESDSQVQINQPLVAKPRSAKGDSSDLKVSTNSRSSNVKTIRYPQYSRVPRMTKRKELEGGCPFDPALPRVSSAIPPVFEKERRTPLEEVLRKTSGNFNEEDGTDKMAGDVDRPNVDIWIAQLELRRSLLERNIRNISLQRRKRKSVVCADLDLLKELLENENKIVQREIYLLRMAMYQTQGNITECQHISVVEPKSSTNAPAQWK